MSTSVSEKVIIKASEYVVNNLTEVWLVDGYHTTRANCLTNRVGILPHLPGALGRLGFFPHQAQVVLSEGSFVATATGTADHVAFVTPTGLLLVIEMEAPAELSSGATYTFENSLLFTLNRNDVLGGSGIVRS